jgi:hypothetical protein
MRWKFRAGALACGLSLCVSTAFAIEGKVIWRSAECRYFNILQTAGGYTLIEQLSAGRIELGDVLDSPDLESSAKTRNVKNLTDESKPLMIWIEAHSSSKTAVLKKIPKGCHPESEIQVN